MGLVGFLSRDEIGFFFFFLVFCWLLDGFFLNWWEIVVLFTFQCFYGMKIFSPFCDFVLSLEHFRSRKSPSFPRKRTDSCSLLQKTIHCCFPLIWITSKKSIALVSVYWMPVAGKKKQAHRMSIQAYPLSLSISTFDQVPTDFLGSLVGNYLRFCHFSILSCRTSDLHFFFIVFYLNSFSYFFVCCWILNFRNSRCSHLCLIWLIVNAYLHKMGSLGLDILLMCSCCFSTVLQC